MITYPSVALSILECVRSTHQIIATNSHDTLQPRRFQIVLARNFCFQNPSNKASKVFSIVYGRDLPWNQSLVSRKFGGLGKVVLSASPLLIQMMRTCRSTSVDSRLAKVQVLMILWKNKTVSVNDCRLWREVVAPQYN